MVKEVYQILNVLCYLVLAIIFCAIQTVLLKLPFFSWMQVDLILLLVTYLGLFKSITQGAILSLLIVHIVEIHSGAPVGLVLSCYSISFIVTLLTKDFFLLQGAFSNILAGVMSGLVWKLAFLGLAIYLGIFPNVWRPTLQFLIPFLVVEALLAKSVFSIGHSIERLTDFESHTKLRFH